MNQLEVQRTHSKVLNPGSIQVDDKDIGRLNKLLTSYQNKYNPALATENIRIKEIANIFFEDSAVDVLPGKITFGVDFDPLYIMFPQS